MNRATDLCTCGKTRDEHPDFFDSDGHTFFPHPQPNAAPKVPFGTKLKSFLESCGEVKFKGTSAFVTELDGTVWEVCNFLRKERGGSTPKVQQ